MRFRINFEAEIASIPRPSFGPNPRPQQMHGARQSLRPAWFDVDSSKSATDMVCKTESGEKEGQHTNKHWHRSDMGWCKVLMNANVYESVLTRIDVHCCALMCESASKSKHKGKTQTHKHNQHQTQINTLCESKRNIKGSSKHNIWNIALRVVKLNEFK